MAKKFPKSFLWVLFIVLFGTIFILQVHRRVAHADDFPQLTQKCRAMHLRYRIWCYSNGECYGIAWPDKYDFIGHNKVSRDYLLDTGTHDGGPCPSQAQNHWGGV